jgi:hypothetical protein
VVAACVMLSIVAADTLHHTPPVTTKREMFRKISELN